MASFLLRAGMVVAALSAQVSVPPHATVPEITVPFIGCPSDGQVGPREPPSKSVSMHVGPPQAAQKLAFYETSDIGVLAPRGWHCFGDYGSGGESIIVTPDAIDTTKIFSSTPLLLTGGAISLTRRWGQTSGRYSVADIIARVFPARMDVVKRIENFDGMPKSTYTFHPYPSDTPDYKSKTVVEYRTAARSEGLGTRYWLSGSDTPIDGVAMLKGEAPDLVLLEVRLSPDQDELTKAIVHDTERDVSRLTR